MSKKDYNQPPVDFGLDPGDLGVIAIALVFLVGMLFLVFGPSPLKGLEKFDAAADKMQAESLAKQQKARHQQEIDAAVKTGEVTMSILPAKKP